MMMMMNNQDQENGINSGSSNWPLSFCLREDFLVAKQLGPSELPIVECFSLYFWTPLGPVI